MGVSIVTIRTLHISSALTFLSSCSRSTYLTDRLTDTHTDTDTHTHTHTHMHTHTICESTWEKGPCRAFFQNRVIATIG